MVVAGVLGPRLGLVSPQLGPALIFGWAPQVALASVAAGVFGVLVALLAGFSRFWLRALLALVITTMTLFAYVWDREVRTPEPAPPASMSLR